MYKIRSECVGGENIRALQKEKRPSNREAHQRKTQQGIDNRESASLV